MNDGAFIQGPTLVALMMGLLAFISIIGLCLPFLQPDLMKSRLKRIADRRRELSEQQRARLNAVGAARPSWRQQTKRMSLMKAVIERLNLRQMMDQPGLRKKLLQAGWRGTGPLITFTFLRLVLPLGGAGVAGLFVFGSSNPRLTVLIKLVIMLLAAAIAYYLPNILLANAIVKRQKEMQRAFPDALDLMVICVESGLSVEAGFGKVSSEMGPDAPVIAEEFGLTNAELAYLSDRRLALENLSDRTGLQTVKSFVTALAQSEKYGTPVAVSLRVVAQENRDSRMSRAEEKAASLPAKLTVPMVLFFLPVLFMVLIGPTIIQALRAVKGG